MGVRLSASRSIKELDAALRQELQARRAAQNVSGSVESSIDWIISVGRVAAMAE